MLCTSVNEPEQRLYEIERLPIEQNFIQDQISDSAYKYQQNLDEKNIKIIGLNTFNNGNNNQAEHLSFDNKQVQDQINSLKRFKEKRTVRRSTF